MEMIVYKRIYYGVLNFYLFIYIKKKKKIIIYREYRRVKY